MTWKKKHPSVAGWLKRKASIVITVSEVSLSSQVAALGMVHVDLRQLRALRGQG